MLSIGYLELTNEGTAVGCVGIVFFQQPPLFMRGLYVEAPIELASVRDAVGYVDDNSAALAGAQLKLKQATWRPWSGDHLPSWLCVRSHK